MSLQLSTLISKIQECWISNIPFISTIQFSCFIVENQEHIELSYLSTTSWR